MYRLVLITAAMGEDPAWTPCPRRPRPRPRRFRPSQSVQLFCRVCNGRPFLPICCPVWARASLVRSSLGSGLRPARHRSCSAGIGLGTRYSDRPSPPRFRGSKRPDAFILNERWGALSQGIAAKVVRAARHTTGYAPWLGDFAWPVAPCMPLTLSPPVFLFLFLDTCTFAMP